MATAALLTAEEFLALPERQDGQRYELSEGELVEVGNAKPLHEYIKATIHEILAVWNHGARAGKVFGESMFRLAETTLRQPDIAFVAKDRLVKDKETLTFPPNLVVEVISDSESAAEAEKKVYQYLRAGVDEVWQVYPGLHTVKVRTGAGTRDLRDGDALETAALPGFSVPVSAFFE